MLERTRLRQDVKQRLLAANTAAGTRIFKSRATPIDERECPAINITTPKENGEQVTPTSPPRYMTELTLNIDVSVATAQNWDDSLDSLCEEVENALLKSPSFWKDFEDIVSYETQIALEDGGEIPIATARMSLGVTYRNAFEPKVDDDFSTMDMDLKYIRNDGTIPDDADKKLVIEGLEGDD